MEKERMLVVMWKASALRASVLYSIGGDVDGNDEVDGAYRSWIIAFKATEVIERYSACREHCAFHSLGQHTAAFDHRLSVLLDGAGTWTLASS